MQLETAMVRVNYCQVLILVDFEPGVNDFEIRPRSAFPTNIRRVNDATGK